VLNDKSLSSGAEVKIERDNKRKIPNKVKFVRFYLNVLEQFI
jgi:hypothetical protein